MKYHINPRTGKAVVCKAKIRCPFGDLEKDHYETRDAARRAYEERMESLVFPSYDSGKIEVSSLPKAMRISSREVLLSKGVYVIGDPALTIGEDERSYFNWSKQADRDKQQGDKFVGASMNGYPVIALDVAGGVGNYSDSLGRTFESVSGTLGVIPLSLLSKMGVEDEVIFSNSSIVSFDEPTIVSNEDNYLSFGKNFQLFVDEPDPEDEFLEEDLKDEFEEDNSGEAFDPDEIEPVVEDSSSHVNESGYFEGYTNPY